MAKKKTGTAEGSTGAEQPGFEQSLERLEEIVAELEGSDVPLERALELFEEGVRLGRACSARLDEAERKITMLLEQADGSLVEKDASAPAPPRAGAAPRGATKPAPVRDEGDDEGDDDGIPF